MINGKEIYVELPKMSMLHAPNYILNIYEYTYPLPQSSYTLTTDIDVTGPLTLQAYEYLLLKNGQ